MECILVWEFILLSRRQYATVTASKGHGTELKKLISKRAVTLRTQCSIAETIMHRAHMPVPSKSPVITKENLVYNDRFEVTSLLLITEKRIQSLAYIMRSQITNTGLRSVAKEWLKEEAALFEQFALYALKETQNASV
jgi:hypothetical protein